MCGGIFGHEPNHTRMKSHIIRVSTVGMSRPDWLAYRQTGLGSTDTGRVLGLYDYPGASAMELYYQKIGMVPVRDHQNVPTFMGNQLEQLTSKLWNYWEGSQASVMQNCDSGRIVRRCQKVKAYLRNPRYPWLFTSLDRLILPHGGRPEGNLELKTISRDEANKWQGGVPLGQIAQVNHQMLVTELEFTELAQLQDGRWFDVVPLEPSTIIMEEIVERTKIFWDKVVAGRKLVNQLFEYERRYDQRGVDNCNAAIDALAPEADGTLATTDYLNERYKERTSAMLIGNAEDLETAELHLDAHKWVKSSEEALRTHENKLKARLGGAQILDFGERGRVTWTETVDGKRIFRNRIKPEA